MLMFLNILIITGVIITVFFLIKREFKIFKNSVFFKSVLVGSAVMHFAMTLLQYYLSLSGNFDSKVFYQRALDAENITSLFKIGSRSISFFIYPLVKIGVDFISISFIYSLIGFIGYVIYLRLSYELSIKNKFSRVILLIFFLFPSIHFWTGSLTKESILFTLLVIIYREIKIKNTLTITVLVCLLLTLFIRPYIALISLFLLIIFYFNRFSKKTKIISCGLLAISGYLLLKFLKITSLSSISKNYEYIIDYASRSGNSSIDLANSNYIERMVLTLFRPLFFDAKTFNHFIVSVENLFWLFIVVLLFWNFRLLKNILLKKSNLYLVSFVVSTMAFFSIYMYNLGLANRMRVMFIPYTVLILLNVLASKKQLKH